MKPASRSHQRFPWLLLAIAAPAAVEVWTCWVGLGSLCGFPKIGGKHGLSTDWTLAIGMEAYGGYALYIWLGTAPGPRSRKFAQWSALGAFALSLIGQVTYHLMLAKHMTIAPSGIIVFVSCLLVVVIAFAAILTHLMHADARNADEAAEESALRAELEAERASRERAEAGRKAALGQAAESDAKAVTLTRKVEVLERKLAGLPKRKQGGNGSDAGSGNGTRKRQPVTAPAEAPVTAPEDEAEEAPADLDSEAKVLWYLDQGLTASKAGVKAGLTDSRGRQIARLKRPAPKGVDEGGAS